MMHVDFKNIDFAFESYDQFSLKLTRKLSF